MELRKVALAVGSMIVVTASSGCGVVGSIFGSSDDSSGGGNGGSDPGGGFSGDLGGVGGLGDLEACATSSARGTLQPVNLIVMFDRSGSMGKYQDNNGVEYDNTAQRWVPVSQGMAAFFSDPQSAGLNATLQFFPPDRGNKCDASAYRNPAVQRTPLPSNEFGDAISSTGPSGDTPTRGALLGAFAIAQNTLASNPDERAVVVLVTDGQPTACGQLQGVYDTARSGLNGKPSISTYVVGVGPDTGNLDEIARNGGTGKATYVAENSDPGKTSSDLVAQLNKIRGEVMSCSFAIPSPGEGKQLDTNAVNVVLTPTGGKASTLSYSSECQGGAGWHYDDPSAPRSIELCESTCDSVKQDKGAKIAIAFGCATNGKVN
ncbi:VWA domain-containing protein [Pendulispora rubella]|uniref:VWA domain-containing protein n=1 Tax=Pendulispora rubella TaxID=2741070 RepID=A0ABZ2KU77_9BACT